VVEKAAPWLRARKAEALVVLKALPWFKAKKAEAEVVENESACDDPRPRK
jgi:hypothetical protein